jgi:MraZ protein
MWAGFFQHSLDKKNRLFIPSKFRSSNKKGRKEFILTYGLERCLFMYDLAGWKNIETKLRKLPLTKADARAFMRIFLSGATQTVVDSQGRVLIPRNLCVYAGIRNEAVVIGVMDRIEIWSKIKWSVYSKKSYAKFSKVSEELVELGI